MLSNLKQRFRDAKTISTLCSVAERYANASGEEEPGAEHFVLAALDLPDGSARRAFARLGADPARFGAAIEVQYQQALQCVGIDSKVLQEVAADAISARRGLYHAQASGQELMQRMAADRRSDSSMLCGAHVLIAASASEHGVVPRALRAMGIDSQRLAAAARAEIQSSR